jgi:replicative DNA helicase
LENLDCCILKGLCTNKRQAMEFASECSEILFEEGYWSFAKTVISYIKTYKEVPTQRILLEKYPNSSENVNLLWDQIMGSSYDEREFRHDVDVLKRRFVKKQMLSLKEKFAKSEDASQATIDRELKLLKETMFTISSVNEEKSYTSKSIKDYLPEFKLSFKNRSQNQELVEAGKIKYGIATLDRATNGGMSRNADYTLVCGESGTGKSIYLNTMSINAWLNGNTIDTPMDKLVKGNNVVFFSLEMPYENHFNRFLSALTGIDYFKLESAKITADEAKTLKKASKFIEEYPYQFKIIDFPKTAKASDIEAILDDVWDEFVPDLLVVDYIGIMDQNNNESGGDSQDWLKMNNVSREFRDILRVYNIPGITAFQLNRHASKDQDAAIGLHRLSRSNLVASHATMIIQLIFRGEKEEMYVDSPFAIIKCRNGMKMKGQCLKQFAKGRVIDDPNAVPVEDPASPDFVDFDDISQTMVDIDWD